MNTPHNINPLLDPNKSFWDRHPFLRWFGEKLLLRLVFVLAACATILKYFEIKVPISITFFLVITGIAVTVFFVAVAVVYFLDQRKRIKELEKENTNKEREIAHKDKEIKCLKELFHPQKREYLEQVFQIARLISSENPEHFDIIIKTFWELKDKSGSKD